MLLELFFVHKFEPDLQYSPELETGTYIYSHKKGA